MNQNTTKSSFGKWGWSMIIYCAISYYISGAIGSDGLNFFPAQFELAKGFNASMVTTLAGLAGWTAIVGGFVFAAMVGKIGAKMTAFIGNIVTGIAMLIFALTNNYVVFIISMFAAIFVAGSVQINVVPNTLMNVWFPKKKGLALGWSTMGLPLCTATFIILLNVLMKVTGSISGAYVVFAVIILVFGVVSLFWCKNSPEELGLAPDNEVLSKEQIAANKKELETHVSKWSVGRLLKNPTVWGIGLGLGLLWMTTVGIVSQLIPRLMSIYIPQNLASGMEMEAAVAAAQGKAVPMLTIAAVFGIVGSYAWGWLDQKLGTKKACYIYGAWYLVTLVLMLLQGVGGAPVIMLSVIFAGVGIGGIGNLIPSMIGTCFGRYDFVQVNKVVAPINTIVRCSGIIVAGIMSGTKFGYNGAYVVFIITTIIGMAMIPMIKDQKSKA